MILKETLPCLRKLNRRYDRSTSCVRFSRGYTQTRSNIFHIYVTLADSSLITEGRISHSYNRNSVPFSQIQSALGNAALRRSFRCGGVRIAPGRNDLQGRQ